MALLWGMMGEPSAQPACNLGRSGGLCGPRKVKPSRKIPIPQRLQGWEYGLVGQLEDRRFPARRPWA